MRFTLFLVLFFTHVCIHAQDPVCFNINNLNGLPSNTVYSILQDAQGFIWLGHDKGMCRYDGKTFKNYAINAQQGRSLSNLLNINGTIWCQDFTGNLYFTEGDSLKKATGFSANGTYSPVGCVADNVIGMVKFDNVKTYNTLTREVRLLQLKDKNQSNAVCFGDNSIHFRRGDSLFTYNYKQSILTKNFELKKELPAFQFLIKINETFFGLTKNTYPYVFAINKKGQKALNLLTPGLFIQEVNVLQDEIWVCTSTGVYCFDRLFKAKYNGQCFFKGSSVTRVLKDRENNYWFSTLNKGVLLVPNINTLLFSYKNQGMSVLEKGLKNQILIGTSSNEILSFDPENAAFQSIFKEATNNEVNCLYFDSLDNRIVFGSDRMAYLKGNQKTNDFEIAGKSITRIDDNIYAAAFSNGVALLPLKQPLVIPNWLKQKNAETVKNVYRLFQETARGRSTCYDAKDSTLYAATAAGLSYFSPKGKGEIKYKNKPIFASQLKFADKTLYVGTFSEGLFTVKNKQNVVSLNEENSGLSKVIYKLQIKENRLWLIGDEMVQEYNISTKKITPRNYANGLPRTEFKDILLQKNQVFVATTEGLVVFNATQNQDSVPPILVTNNILVNENITDSKSMSYLASEDNNIKINFSLLSFKLENKLQLKYQINGGDWLDLETQSRVLNLPSLASGNYTVLIGAYDEYGQSKGNNLKYDFSIAAPFYKRWWFIAFILATISALFYGYFKVRLNEINAKNELLAQKLHLEQELQQSMLSSIKSQMNPHFLFNALNTIQSYIYTNDKENASHYLGKFSELTRLILEMSNKDIVSLSDEIKSLHLYLDLEGLRFEDKLNYSLEMDENVSVETTYIPSMLIQPYIENAIKHGLLHQRNKWVLSIIFNKENDSIKVVVDDNGIGRKRSEELNKNKAKHHQSFASQANQKRLEILNKGSNQRISLQIVDKMDAYGNATGTTVTMLIPIVKK